jgi:hypothetical protein
MRLTRRGILAAVAVFQGVVLCRAAVARTHERSPSLRTEGEVVTVFYCVMQEDDPLAAARVHIRVAITNDADAPAIVARKSGFVHTVGAASSLEALRRGVFLGQMSWSEMYSDEEANSMPRFVLSPTPGSDFAVLARDESIEVAVDISVQVAREDMPQVPTLLQGGEKYWLQFDVPLWPYPLASEKERLEASKKWQEWGRLELNGVNAVVPLHLPLVTQVHRCGSNEP